MAESADSPYPSGADRLWVAARHGDAQAWRNLVELYSPRLYALAMRLTADHELAEEITQATFVKLLENMNRYREQGCFEPWLFRIAINLLRDQIRQRTRQPTQYPATDPFEESANPFDPPQRESDPFYQLSRQEDLQRLQEAVKRLSPAEQEVLYLRHTVGLSFAQIAQTLQEPLGTVLARTHRALAKLRKILMDPAAQPGSTKALPFQEPAP